MPKVSGGGNLKFTFGSVVVLTLLCCEQVAGSYKSEIYYNLVSVGSSSAAVNANCQNDLKDIVNGIDGREIWGLKILDASGRFGAGFVWGNNYLLGVRRACELLHKPIPMASSPMFDHLHHPNLTRIASPFPVEYRIIYVRHTSPLQFDVNIYDRKVLTIGLCFPQSCSNEDAFEIAEEVFETLNFPGRELVGKTTVLSSKTLKLRDNFWTIGLVKMFTYVTLFCVANIIIGTIYVYKVKKSRSGLQKKNDDIIQPVRRTFWEKWFACFSLIDNFKTIMSLTTGKESLSSVHGIRALTMPWIVLGHIVLYGHGAIDNLESVFTYTELLFFQPVTTDFLGVDTFVALSGFLVAYLFFEYQKKSQKNSHGIGTMIKAIVSRYIRLVPFLFIVVLMSYFLIIYLEDTTPYKLGEDIEKYCSKYYWRNLLLLNNIFPGREICCTWTWFASNDYQCYAIGIVVLVLYSRNKTLGFALGNGITIFCIVLNMVYSVQLKYTLSMDAFYYFQDYTYLPTFTRLPCYFVGLAAGHYLSKINRQLILSKAATNIYWILTVSVFTSNVYFHVYKGYHPIIIPLYAGFARIGWALGVSWTIIACSTGYGGFMTKVLGSKYLLPLSRLSYSMYLTNVLAIPLIYFSAENSYHVVFITYVFEFCGIFIACFLFALLSTLIYESPINMIFRTFLDRK